MNQKGLVPIIIAITVTIIALIGGGLVASKKITLPPINYQANIQTIQQPSTAAAEVSGGKDENQFKGNQQNTSQTKTSPKPQITPQVTSKTISPIIKKGNLKGRVVGGYYSRPLSSVDIKAKGLGIEKTAKSDNSGNFTFNDLPIGQYNLLFSHPDYNIADWNNYAVAEGENVLPRTPNGFLKVFKPTLIKGTVYVDRNDNRQKDSGDEGLDALVMLYNKISDNSWNLNQNISVNKSGNFSVEIKEGSNYKLVPGEYTFYRKPEPVELVVDGYGETKEYSFPYYPTSSSAKLIIYVFNDKNENNTQDADEENLDYYYAEVTNTSTGKNDKTSVAAQGTVSTYNDYGVYRVKLTAGDESWATYYRITKSEDTVSITNTSGDQTVRLGAHKLY